MTNQEEIRYLCYSDDPEKRIIGLNKLKVNLSSLPNKHQAWNDLIKLSCDENRKVKWEAAEALSFAVPFIPDKEKVWDDLIRLINSKSCELSHFQTEALISAFMCISDKSKAWSDIHKLTKDKDSKLRDIAVSSFFFIFDSIPDKKQAWNDLHRLTKDKDPYVRSGVAGTISVIIDYVPDKQRAWKDLIKLINDEDVGVQKSAVRFLHYTVREFPDKQKAWNDLIKLTNPKHAHLHYFFEHGALGHAFSGVQNKQKAWVELHSLASDICVTSRLIAASSLGPAYPHIPDEKIAWETLHKLTDDKVGEVRGSAARSLGLAFPYIFNKEEAWKDLHRLTSDNHWLAKIGAAEALENAFPSVSNKEQAWEDLHRILNEKHKDEKIKAIQSLYSSFTYITDKQMAFEDLHRLIEDDNKYVRGLAGATIGHVFADIPDKQKAWEDLVRLTVDNNSVTRVHAYYDLGKVSIFKASQVENEDDYRKELERAIEFFEKASKENIKENISSNTTQFCLPFYRTFHTIIFEQKITKEVIDRYLEEAEYAIRGSKSKEQLFEVVVILANALEEVQNYKNLDLDVVKNETKLYTKYFDRVEEILRDTEKTAPFAVRTMIKGLPILKRNISKILEDIQKKTDQISEQTKGTPFEQLGNELSLSGQLLLEVTDPVGFERNFQFFESHLTKICSKLPESQEISKLLKHIKEEQSIENKISLMNDLSSEILYQLGKINSETNSTKKPLSKKIVNSSGYSLGAASALAALSYSVCGVYNLQNQHNISIGVFTIIFFSSFMLFFVISEK